MGENKAGLEPVSVAKGMGTATVHGESAPLLSAPHIRQLVLDKSWYGHYLLRFSACALPHQLFLYFSIFLGVPQESEQY
jgi:hypothetical protein